ncbi:MAG: hypothetical protein WCG93_11085 [Paludibacter sp.]
MNLKTQHPLLENLSEQNSSFFEKIEKYRLEWAFIHESEYYEPRIRIDVNSKEYKLQLEILNWENSKAVLLLMKILLAKLVSSLRRLEQEFLVYITFLFGLSSSQSSFIFHAFSGASLCRTPNL